jgi:hypothetical protein
MAAVFELEIPATEKLVLLAMADHARDDGTGCYPSVETLARKTSQSRRGVQKIIRRLEARALLKPTAHARGGRSLSTEYQITLEKSEQSSLFSRQKGRTSDHKTANAVTERANLSAQKGEPGSPQPTTEPLEPSRTKALAFEPPNPPGVLISTWMTFLDQAKKLGRPLLPGAVELALRRLAELASSGNDPQQVVEQSIARRWYWFFPLSKNGSKGGIDADERTSDNFKAAGLGED